MNMNEWLTNLQQHFRTCFRSKFDYISECPDPELKELLTDLRELRVRKSELMKVLWKTPFEEQDPIDAELDLIQEEKFKIYNRIRQIFGEIPD